MTRTFRWLFRLLVGVAVIALICTAAVYYLVGRSLPDYDGDYELAGLDAPVRILRDANAVPHVFGDSTEATYFGLGFAHAQDRLWQMEVQRLGAQGRLSAIFGARALPFDRMMRTLDLYGLALSAAEQQSPEVTAALQAYSDGVNAWFRVVNERALGRGAPEFFLFGGDLAPWRPVDSIAILKVMALRLTGAVRSETRRARFLLQLPPEKVADLFPNYPDTGLIALPEYASLFRPGVRFADIPQKAPFFGIGGPPEFAGASNAWAVSAERSATNTPLLASDPHLWLSSPSIWMLARMQFPDGGVIGGSLPGVPGILVGRNDDIAWGLTTANVDDQDLFIEELHPEDPLRYRTPDGWEQMETRETSIQVKGAAPARMTLRWTRHGPVMPPDQFGVGPITPEGHVAALAWTALAADDRSIEAALTLMRARSLEEAQAAAEMHVAPAQNVVIADQTGVGMFIAGRSPLRRLDSGSRGRIPSPGWRAENDWLGFVDQADLPRSIRPKSGVVANANNRTTNAPFPNHISHDWASPYRIRRIERLLNDREFHTLTSFQSIQTDTVSGVARAILPLIATELWWTEDGADRDQRSELAREALTLLADWNGEMNKHQPEPLIFSAWMRSLTRRIASDELGPLTEEFAGPRPLFVERVFHDIEGAAAWCDVNKTVAVETCPQIAALALEDAITELSDEYGAQITGWRWGEAHQARHVHTPLGHAGPLGWLMNIEQETSGGDETVMRGLTAQRGPDPYANVHAGGFRGVYDFADLDRSQAIIATGQSGHVLSRFYDNLSELWASGQYIPISMAEGDILAGALGEIRLKPAE